MNPAQSIPLTKKQIAIACAVCLISAFALGALAFTAFPTSAGFLKSERTNGFWFPLADGISNAYHMWRLDPFSLLASYFTDFSHWSGAFSPIQVFLFSAGSWSLFFSFTATVQFFKRAALITLGTWSLSTLLLILFGQNSVVWGSLMWLPFSILALSTAQLYWRTEHSNKPLLLISVVLCSLLIYFSANQLAWLVSALTLLIVYFAHEDLSDRSNSNALFHEKLWIIILLVPAIWGLFSAPIADFPDYPSTSHLVPDDGLAGLTRPLIGKDYPLAVINRAGLKKLLMPYSLSALILLPLSWLIIRRSHYRAFYMITFLLSILLVLDILLPEHFSQISPLSAISRMLPGVSMMSLAPIILALLIFSFIFALCLSHAIRALFLIACCIASSIVITKGHPLLVSTQIQSLLDSLTYADASEIDREVIASPSLYTIASGLCRTTACSIEQLEAMRKTYSSQFQYASASVLHAKFLSHPESSASRLLRLSDDKERTRWSSGTGEQVGGELIIMRLPKSVKVGGIELDTGNFPADFPRGLQILTKPDCEDLSLDSNTLSLDQSWTELYKSNDWQGSTAFSPRGFPYFEGQQSVRVLFPGTVTNKCFAFMQIAKEASFDWSVAELRVLKAE